MIAVYYTQLQCLCFCMWESVDHTVLSTQSLIAGEWAKQPDSIPSAKRSDEPERCSDAGFEGLPGRLQEVIRGKYVISSSSSFRPPLDQPASVWENWFSPSPPPLLSFFSSFFPLLRFHLRLVHPLSSAFLWDREGKENSLATTGCSHIYLPTPPTATSRAPISSLSPAKETYSHLNHFLTLFILLCPLSSAVYPAHFPLSIAISPVLTLPTQLPLWAKS